MALDDTTRVPIVRNDERAHDDARRRPAKLLRNDAAQPCLDVQSLQQLLEIADAALDLDNKERSRAGVPCNKVAAPPIPVMVETHLGLYRPAVGGETSSGRLLEMGVLAIDEPVEVSALPPNLDRERGTQRVDDS